MFTIVSGTNRKGNQSVKIAKIYRKLLKGKGIDAVLLSLEKIDVTQQDEALKKLEQEVIIPTKHFIFIVPEYNGSFPGILKLLFDNTGNYKIWSHKDALLTGVSSGRAGNLRGLDHLSDVLNYLKITVHPNKLPISSIEKLVDGNGELTDAETLGTVSRQLDEYLAWIKK